MSSLDHAQTLSSQCARWFRAKRRSRFALPLWLRQCRNDRNEQNDVRINERSRRDFPISRFTIGVCEYRSHQDPYRGIRFLRRWFDPTGAIAQDDVSSVEKLRRVLRDTLNRIKQRDSHRCCRSRDDAGRRRCRARPWRAGSRTPRITAIPEIRERWFRNHGRHCGRARIRGFRRRCRARAAPSAASVFHTASRPRSSSLVYFWRPAMTRRRCSSRRRACASIRAISDLHALAALRQRAAGPVTTRPPITGPRSSPRDPDHSYANRRLAALLERAGDAAGAIDCLRRVVEVTRGQDLDAITSLGITLSADGQHEEAHRRCSRTSRRASPTSARPRPTWRTPCSPPVGSRTRSPASPRSCAWTRNRRRRTAASDSPIKGSSAGTRRPRPFERPSSWRPIRRSAPTTSGSRCPRSASATTRARAAARGGARARRCRDSRGAAGAARPGRRRRRRAIRAGRARAALRRRHQDVRAARGARVPPPAEQDGIARGLVPARRRDRPAGARSGDQRVGARRQPPGRGAGRARDHHGRRRWRRPRAAADGRRRERGSARRRCCCASAPPTARR